MVAEVPDRHPVVLVHGIYDTRAKFATMADFLTQGGWSVHCLDLEPNDGSASLAVLATQVQQYIDQKFAPQQPVDLIGFSMGGLVTRYYLQRLGGVERVRRYITISAPNQGTLLGYSLPYQGVREMAWQSDFLRDLNRDCCELLAGLQVTVIWTPFDLMILPPSSSHLEIGREIILPVLVHAWMVSDARCLAEVALALAKPLT
ncbi:alpha/beta fold hydrolase [Synechocystis salina]|uniref:Triacylglycerol lipase n=1 Tax=Synechocystis salina LEGE 00031 TaxID=1828736 RepID=A0ABR9VRR5_9SYNC|nr:triacylglycerol lipase [Synechocystis salina LEGE 00041]MBE9253736.1 triacylglycerol lipase [Synechocystis salina LEGE 00031]